MLPQCAGGRAWAMTSPPASCLCLLLQILASSGFSEHLETGFHPLLLPSFQAALPSRWWGTSYIVLPLHPYPLFAPVVSAEEQWLPCFSGLLPPAALAGVSWECLFSTTPSMFLKRCLLSASVKGFSMLCVHKQLPFPPWKSSSSEAHNSDIISAWPWVYHGVPGRRRQQIALCRALSDVLFEKLTFMGS